jgi:nicotinamidase-related amidase
MPVTTLDPTPALIVIDLQKGLRSLPTVHPMGDVVARSAELAGAFRSYGLPVVLVNATGRAPGRTEAPSAVSGTPPADWAQLMDELDAQPSDHLVSKQTWGAFHGTDLDEYLRSVGATQVVVVGIATSAGVESSARAGHEHGYHVVLATDAMTDRSAEAHAYSVERVFPRIGETGTTAEILALLAASR